MFNKFKNVSNVPEKKSEFNRTHVERFCRGGKLMENFKKSLIIFFALTGLFQKSVLDFLETVSMKLKKFGDLGEKQKRRLLMVCRYNYRQHPVEDDSTSTDTTIKSYDNDQRPDCPLSDVPATRS